MTTNFTIDVEPVAHEQNGKFFPAIIVWIGGKFHQKIVYGIDSNQLAFYDARDSGLVSFANEVAVSEAKLINDVVTCSINNIMECTKGHG